MRTQTKIMFLLLLTMGAFAGVFIGNQYIKKRQENLFLKANEEAKKLVVDNILKFKEKSLLSPVMDYSCWDEMVSYLNNPTKQWENVNLTTLSAFHISYSWIYNKNFTKIYSAFDSSKFQNEIPLSKEIIENAFKGKGFCHFYMNVRDTLFEITGGTIVPSADFDHKTVPNGYFFVGKLWSKDYIVEMEREMDFSINFRPVTGPINNNIQDNSKITISKTFNDSAGNEIMIVDFTSKNQLINDLSSTNWLSYSLIGLLITTIFAFLFAIRRWVTHPLKHITKSLNNEDHTIVDEFVDKNNEFGEIARLIKNFFDQKIQIEIEIAERIDSQQTVKELYEETVNLNHELQASEEELRQNLDMTLELNEVLSRQQREITDSINYAGRIQAALLPPIELIKQLKREFFILYKPRSIVSGDFYWVTQRNNKTIIAIADCTGHGVPGGFMSMLGMAYLAEIVNQNFEFSSGEILDQLRKRVVESLHQYGNSGESKDGMDIALCIIDFEKMSLQFSGAYNPLYIVRDSISSEGLTSSELIEIKGDRMPIGYSLKLETLFTTNKFSFLKNDVMYLTTDGFQDQISNTTRHKFKRSILRDLLVEIHTRDFEDQKNILEIVFDEYREDYPQIDDVLAFGMKI